MLAYIKPLPRPKPTGVGAGSASGGGSTTASFGAAQPGAAPGLTTASLLILGAIALVSLVVSPLASAAALRSYLK